MKSISLVIILLVFLIGTTVAVGQSRASQTQITATETLDPFGLFGPPVGVLLLPGNVACPGSTPTGDPLQPCPPGSRLRVRGSEWVSRVESSDPGGSGFMTVSSSANWDTDYTGPGGGTFSLALDVGGTWNGTWEGIRFREGDHWVLSLHAVGHGTGGDIDGAKMLVVEQIIGFTPLPIAYVGSIEARILYPGSK